MIRGPRSDWRVDDHLARPAVIALGGALLLAAYWRVPAAGSALLFGDEFHSLRRIVFGYQFLISDFSTTGSGMALPLLQRMLSDLIGLNHWTVRAPALLSGLALVGCLYPLGRRLVGGNAALVATFLAAGSSMLIYYSHYGRSYSMMAWLCLLLVYSLQRIIESDGSVTRYYLYCVGLVAALPYVHLSSLATVSAVIGASLIVLWVEGRVRESVQLGGAALGGLVLALLLHAPAFASVSEFITNKTSRSYFGEFGFWDVAALLTGGRVGAMLVLPLLLFALARAGHRGGVRVLPLIAACLAPALALIVIRPFGDAYAYARYAITAVPFVCLAIGWLLSDVVGGKRESDDPTKAHHRRGWVIGAGALLACGFFVAGPYGLIRSDVGPHANTYLGLYPLAPFDDPWTETPAFYRSLAEKPGALRIVEAPALVNRSRHLYRNYFLQHGIETWLGVLPQELASLPEGPYVSLADPDWRQKADADYLILHVRIGDEVRDYWKFVYESPNHDPEAPAIAAYMMRHSRYGKVASRESAELAPTLRRELGNPVYEDQRILVWDLRGSRVED